MWLQAPRNGSPFRRCHTGAAWLPSARAVRCTLKWGNERNPCRALYVSHETALARGRKVGTTSNQHGSYALGYTHDTMASTEGCQIARWSKSHKAGLSSDCRLKLACMKLDLLVNAHQIRRVEYVLGSCTHRPSHHESWQHPKALL